MRFEDLRLNEPLLRAVRTAGYEDTTPIQAKAIPHVLAGKDVLGCAQTGTGKTAAFALPILQRLGRGPMRRNGPGRRIRTLVLAPTRELAQQIHDSFLTYGQHTDIRQTVIFGGVNQNPQARALRAGADILVATPGRLLDLIGQGLISLRHVEILVLDEADRMLDMGFLPDIRRVLAQVPKERQTLLFSATMPAPIRKLADSILHEAVPVQVAPRVSAPAPTVEHSIYHVEKPGKTKLLTSLLDHTPYSRVLVFTRTKHGADKVVKQLGRAGMDAAALHGNKSQGARTRALAAFRSARTPVLVATDIAARGLDVEDISHVINYDLPHEPETYVHRIGRTGRAGESGRAVSFCTGDDRDNLRAIERLLRTQLQKAEDPPGYTSPRITPTLPSARDKGAAHKSGRPHNGCRNRTQSGPGSGDPARSNRSRRKTKRRRARLPVGS
ncbi:MAG: DEAD/DEAH box helicase [bacterium]|nr:DEAD/DEAH box helicase [bacterium]